MSKKLATPVLIFVRVGLGNFGIKDINYGGIL